MYSTAQKGSSHRMGMVRSPFCVPSQIRKDAAELLRMISSHDCRAQILLLVFTSDLRSGGTRNAGDSHGAIQGSPIQPFPPRHCGWASGEAGLLQRSPTQSKAYRYN